jgi:hypothetical protein
MDAQVGEAAYGERSWQIGGRIGEWERESKSVRDKVQKAGDEKEPEVRWRDKSLVARQDY